MLKDAYFVAMLIVSLSPQVLSTRTSKDAATMQIGNSTVQNAWQSSAFASLCFYGRSAAAEDQLSKTEHSYQFVHCGNRESADSGYHWFVVQLNSTVRVTAVSISGRNDSDARVYNRTAGIEVWTSAAAIDFSSVDHCYPLVVKISARFKSTRSQWKLCGVTRARNQSVSRAEVLTVNCSAQVTMLLLRMFVANRSTPFDDALSFAGIELKLGRSETTERTPINDRLAGVKAGLCIAVLIVGFLAFLLLFVIIFYRKNWHRNRSLSMKPGAPKPIPNTPKEGTYINEEERAEATGRSKMPLPAEPNDSAYENEEIRPLPTATSTNCDYDYDCIN